MHPVQLSSKWKMMTTRQNVIGTDHEGGHMPIDSRSHGKVAFMILPFVGRVL